MIRIFAALIFNTMGRIKTPNTYVIIFTVLLICTVATWLVPGGVPQTWQVFAALLDGFVKQADIIAFVLIIGGAFWILNQTKALDEGISKFISKVQRLERWKVVRMIGVGNIIITSVMLLFGLFGAVFGMSEETIAFVGISIPLAKSLGYDEIVGVCMVYVAAHVGFAGAMLNPFTVGIAQGFSELPLFSGIEYRTMCWIFLMMITIAVVLIYANRIRIKSSKSDNAQTVRPIQRKTFADAVKTLRSTSLRTWVCFAVISVVLALFAYNYADACNFKLGETSYHLPWLLWVLTGLFILLSLLALKTSSKMFILNILLFTILFMVTGTMGYGWYLRELCALFLAMGIAIGLSADYSADSIAKEFVAGAKDIFSAALIIGLASGIVVVLQNGNVISQMLQSISNGLSGAGRATSLGFMYGFETFINLFIPSATAKATATIPIFAELSDMINVPRQSTVLAFQFGDGFTNMITPCSGVLMAVLSVAKIQYASWVKLVWKFILVLVILGFVLLLPTIYFNLSGF